MRATSLLTHRAVSRTAVPLFKSFHTLSILSRDQLPNAQLTHWDADSGRPAMVNVTNKTPTQRTATASGRIFIPQVAYELIGGNPPIGGLTQNSTTTSAELETAKAKARAKGDVLSVAQLAGIMAAKRTSNLIPLCHPLSLSHISVVLTPCPGSQESTSSYPSMPSVYCESSVTCEGKTGVEMEALTAVSVALLTVWDMLKAVAGKEMEISDIHVSKKTGGKSGDFERVHAQDVHIASCNRDTM